MTTLPKPDWQTAGMKPYYEDTKSGIVIYHGDCREVLRHIGSVDITFSSPPYNTIAATKPSGLFGECKRKLNDGYLSHSDDMPEEDYQEWVRGVFDACKSITKGLVWINHKTRFRDKRGIHPLELFPWPFYSEIVWDRGGSVTLNARKFAPSHEFLYGFGEPHFWDDAQNTLLSVWRIMPERDVKGHPCPFPVSIARRCIASSCPINGVVLDPFVGSGTTLRAAKDLGRRAIGIELEERYCEIAARRLEQQVLQFTD